MLGGSPDASTLPLELAVCGDPCVGSPTLAETQSWSLLQLAQAYARVRAVRHALAVRKLMAEADAAHAAIVKRIRGGAR